MSHELQVTDVSIYPYNLSVTTRANGESTEVMAELTYRTIVMWLHITKYLKQGVHKLEGGSVEQRYADVINASVDTDMPTVEPFEFKETFGDSRVTVWDTYRGAEHPCFHLNSDDNPQVAIDVWVAQGNGIKKAIEKFSPEQSTDAPATPKKTPPQNAPNTNVGSLYTKKDAIAKLSAGDKFKMKIVQIEKHSKDGKDFYEFFEPYGGKAGQYSAASVFTDNEVGLNNGLIAYLDTLGVKLGQALTGEWVVNCAVGKPKTKMFKGVEQTFTNIYVNSFEGQPETV